MDTHIPDIATAFDWAGSFLSEGLARGVQSDLYKDLKEKWEKLRTAVWNRYNVHQPDFKESQKVVSLLDDQPALANRIAELSEVLARINAHRDEAILMLTREILEIRAKQPEIATVNNAGSQTGVVVLTNNKDVGTAMNANVITINNVNKNHE